MATKRKVSSKEKPVRPIVKKLRGRLTCVSAHDEELVDAYPNGQEFDLIPRLNRSLKQYRLYRKLLSEIAKGSDRWPTGTHLHNELKIKLGYWHYAWDTKLARMVKQPNSTSFDQMTAPEFKEYFDKALVALTEYLGSDPMEVLNK